MYTAYLRCWDLRNATLLSSLGWLSFSAPVLLKFVSGTVYKIVARPKFEGAARVARSALEAAGEDFGRSLQYCWCSLTGAGCFWINFSLIKMLA